MLTAHVHSTEQNKSGTGEKNMIRKDDVSDNNCSKLYYYDYIIVIFLPKKLPRQNVLKKKIFM